MNDEIRRIERAIGWMREALAGDGLYSAQELRDIRHLDLFSGIGGFALAVRWLGHETVGFVERDEWCRSVLRKHWPEVPQHDDIKTYRPGEFGAVDLITGGFPCQPFSVAGNRRGAADDRALWPEMARVIAERRPTYVLAENVAGIVKMELDRVHDDLESLGYSIRSLIVPAVAVDAPHRRDRVWIMAHDGSKRRSPGSDEIRTGRHSPQYGSSPMAYTSSECEHGSGESRRISEHGPDDRCEDVPYTNNAGCQEQWRPQPGGEFLSASEQYCRWPVEPGVGRVADGIPNRVDRLRGLGNAIVPQVAYEILKVMIGEAPRGAKGTRDG